MGGRGGWAVAPPVVPGAERDDVKLTVLAKNDYPQILGQDKGIPLFYGDPYLKGAGERTYGTNGKIWNYLGERIDRGYITLLKINSSAMTTVSRNTTLQLDLILSKYARLDYLVWSVSDTAYATVDKNGLLTIGNKAGMVTVTARDTDSGLMSSIVLRIS